MCAPLPAAIQSFSNKRSLCLLFVLLLFECFFSRTASFCITLVHCRQMKRIQTQRLANAHIHHSQKRKKNHWRTMLQRIIENCVGSVSVMRRTLFENDHSEFPMDENQMYCISIRFKRFALNNDEHN